jgi:hypothetical protein
MITASRMPTAIEILALRYVSPKGEGNPTINAMLAELGLAHYNNAKAVDVASGAGHVTTANDIAIKTLEAEMTRTQNLTQDLLKWA